MSSKACASRLTIRVSGETSVEHLRTNFLKVERPARGDNSNSGPRDLVEWLASIEKEMTELWSIREVYAEIREMHRRNPEIQRPSIFYSWMEVLYNTHVVVAVARLVDERKGTRSFVRLLMKIKARADEISRKSFVADYVSSPGMASISKPHVGGIANREFDQLVGEGLDSLSPVKVEKDIQDLKASAKPVLVHRHERVAHLDAIPPIRSLLSDQLDLSIAKLGELLSKYSMLLRRVSCGPATIVYDWKAIFRVAWEPGEQAAGNLDGHHVRQRPDRPDPRRDPGW